MAKVKVEQFKELTIFQVADILCAIDITEVKEIVKHLEISRVMDADDYIRGVASLRGEILSVIDVRVKFGEKAIPLNEDMRIIVINFEGENTGLLVDKIHDVEMINVKSLEPLTSNINGVNRDYFSGIYKMDNKLAAVLNTNELLKYSHANSE
jgi:purine-binding chemotaxis protein CheW